MVFFLVLGAESSSLTEDFVCLEKFYILKKGYFHNLLSLILSLTIFAFCGGFKIVQNTSDKFAVNLHTVE